MVAASNQNLANEVRQLREEIAELRASFNAPSDRNDSRRGTASLIDAALLRRRIERYTSSVLRRFSPAVVSEISRRVIYDGQAEARRWLSIEMGHSIAASTLSRFTEALRSAIDAVQPSEPLGRKRPHKS